MDGVILLQNARRAGLRVRAEGDRLIVQGPRRLESVVRTLIEEKPSVLAALADEVEVAWRVEAMRRQLPQRGPIPLLLARAEAIRPDGGCRSCGSDLLSTDRSRCKPCTDASIAVIESDGNSWRVA